MEQLQDISAGILMIIGGLFTVVAAVGIIRFPDVYSRMHAGSKAGTLGSCVMLIALMVVSNDAATVLRAIAAILFFLLTAPVSAHLLAKASYVAGYRLWEGSVLDEMPTDVARTSANKDEAFVRSNTNNPRPDAT